MATTIVTKSGSGAPTASDLVAGELAVDLTNGRLYTENSGGTVLELGLNPSGNVDVTGTVTATGTSVFASLDISGDIDVDGTTNLDVVDIDGAVDMASTLAVAGVVTANAGVVVDNITIDGQEIDVSSGDLTLDVAGNIAFDADGANVYFKDGGAIYGQFVSVSAGKGKLAFGNSGQQYIEGLDTGNGGSGAYLKFGYGATEAMRIDASGNVGIGTSSPSANLHVYESGSGDGTLKVGNAQGADTANIGKQGASAYGATSAGDAFVYTSTTNLSLMADGAASAIKFATGGNTERMRIDASGDVGIGLNNGNHRLQVLNDKANFAVTKFTSTSAATSEYGISLTLTNDPNDATRYFLYCAGGVTGRAAIYANGNIANTNNSYTGISDLKLKENIVDAGSQWDDIKALRVRKYSFKEENASSATQIGVIAQEVEAAGMAGLVYESPDQVTAEDGTIEDTGEVTKTVKYSILYMKSVKALQEAMERIESLEARIAALES